MIYTPLSITPDVFIQLLDKIPFNTVIIISNITYTACVYTISYKKPVRQ